MDCRAAVFQGAGKSFQLQRLPVPDPEPGAVVAAVRLATVCGSDLHTWHGRRAPAPPPAILGHEACGEVYATGGPVEDLGGILLQPGDRIVWSYLWYCGRCAGCVVDRTPAVSCRQRFRYGVTLSADRHPYLNGAYAEYIYLRPGTGIVKIPHEIAEDRVAAPINCALTTALAGLERVGRLGFRALAVMQGAGQVGLSAVAVLKGMGAREVVAVDLVSSRLELARDFGADQVIDLESGTEALQALEGVADVVFEATGNPSAVQQGLAMLRPGGYYVLVGSVFPNAVANLDTSVIVQKSLTLLGNLNAEYRHLVDAVEFVRRTHRRIPFAESVGRIYPLDQINEAFAAATERAVARVALAPDPGAR